MNRRRYLSHTGGVSAGLIFGVIGGDPVRANGAETAEAGDNRGGLFAIATDAAGSSIDSRVALGTLGHHHEWAGTEPQELSFDDTDAGTEYWHAEGETGFGHSAPTVVDGTVYIGTETGDQPGALVARDAVSGEEQWRFETDSSIRSSPQVVDTTAFVIAVGDALYAIDTADGTEQWRSTDVRVNTDSSPTVTDERVFITGRELYVVDTVTGDTRWRFGTEGRATTTPTVAEETVFVAFRSDVSEADEVSFNSTLYAVDTSDGTEKWQFELGDRSPSDPTVANGLVYIIGEADGRGVSPVPDVLYAVDAATGEKEWQFDLGEEVQPTSPTVADDFVYVVGDTGDDAVLHSVDSTTGDSRWARRFRMDGSTQAPPTVADGTVFIIGGRGMIHAAEVTTGQQRWRFDTGGQPSSAPTVVDGTLFVASSHNPPPQAINGHEDQPGFGISTALAGLAGGGYLLRKRLASQEHGE